MKRDKEDRKTCLQVILLLASTDSLKKTEVNV